jgi:hypothetical protein
MRFAPRSLMLVMTAAILAVPLSAPAVDRHWNVGSGAWTTSTNWSPNGVPSGVDNAFIDFFANGSGGVARLTSQSVPAITSATVNNGASFNITTFGLNPGSILIGTDLIVGTSGGQGTLNLLAGFPVFNSGTGGMTVVDSLRLGVLSGSGVVNQNAGAVAIGNRLILGDSNQPGSEFKGFGAYNLSGGLLRSPRIDVGQLTNSGSTSGMFNVSGSAAVNNVATMSVLAGSTFNLSGSASVTIASNSLVVLAGVVNQSGGNMNVTSFATDMYVEGTYNLSGGSLTVESGLFAGTARMEAGSRFNYSGGDVYVDFLIVYADTGGANGARVTLSSGGNKTLRTGVISLFDGATVDLNDNAMTIEQSSGDFIRQKIARG